MSKINSVNKIVEYVPKDEENKEEIAIRSTSEMTHSQIQIRLGGGFVKKNRTSQFGNTQEMLNVNISRFRYIPNKSIDNFILNYKIPINYDKYYYYYFFWCKIILCLFFLLILCVLVYVLLCYLHIFILFIYLLNLRKISILHNSLHKNIYNYIIL